MLACLLPLPFPNLPLIARHEAPGTRKSRHEEERVHWSFLPFMEPYYYWHFGSWNLIPQTTYRANRGRLHTVHRVHMMSHSIVP